MASDADAHRLVMRGGGSAALGYLIRFGARLLFLLIAARLFGAALFGAYSLAIAAVELAVAVGGLGMKRYLFQLLEERPVERPPGHVLFDAAIMVAAASALLASGLILIALALPAHLLAANTAFALAIVAPMVAGQALLDLLLAASRWTQTMRVEVVARSLVEPYAAIAAAAAAYLLGFDQAGLVISYWAGTLAALVYAAAGTRRRLGSLGIRFYRPSPRRLAAMTRDSFWPATTDLVGALFARLDLYLVGAMLGEAPAGIYNMARQIRTPIRQVRQSFDGLLTPVLARTLALRGPAEAGAAAASASRLILAIQLPMVAGFVVIGQPLLDWLGPDFAAAYWPLVVLAGAETILAAFGVGDLILLYRRPALGLWVTLASIAVNLVAAWFLVGRFGLDGAAFSVLLAVGGGTLVRRILLRTSFGIAFPISGLAGPAAAMIAATLATLALQAVLRLPPLWTTAILLVAVLATYAAVLHLWHKATGQSLKLVNLQTD